MRSHGETVGGVPADFRRFHAAEDVCEFMVCAHETFQVMLVLHPVQKALKLPPCHLFGLSLGACVALQIAVSHPERVLSLFMLSPLPLIEVS